MHELVIIENGHIHTRFEHEEGKFLILNFRRVLIVVSFLLGKSPASVY